MKKIICMLLLAQGALMMAQTKTVVTPYGEKVTFNPNALITANNGLTAASGNVQLGGALTQASILTTTSAYTLAIQGLQTGGISDNILVADATTGVLKYVTRASLGAADNLGNHIATQNLMMNRHDVVFADRSASNANTFSFYKDSGVFGIWSSAKSSNTLSITEAGNVGIGTSAPTNTLHVKAAANPIKIEGLTASGNTADSPLVVGTDGVVKTGAFPQIDIVPSDTGTVMAIDGKLVVAQEITTQMSADFSINKPNTIIKIGNVINVIIDNKSKYSSNDTANDFSVETTGIYLITINTQLYSSDNTSMGNPAVGIVDNTTGKWVARVNDAIGLNKLYTESLVTSLVLDSTHTYSFACAFNGQMTLRAFSSDETGTGPVSFFSVKRLK